MNSPDDSIRWMICLAGRAWADSRKAASCRAIEHDAGAWAAADSAALRLGGGVCRLLFGGRGEHGFVAIGPATRLAGNVRAGA